MSTKSGTMSAQYPGHSRRYRKLFWINYRRSMTTHLDIELWRPCGTMCCIEVSLFIDSATLVPGTTTQSSFELVFRIVPSLDITRIGEDKNFKKSVLEELEQLGRFVNLTSLVREYVEAIGRIHETLRTLLTQDVEKWEEVLLALLRRSTESFGENLVGLAVVAIDDSGRYAESEQIFQDMIDYRRELARKNSSLTKLSARYVSGSCREGDSRTNRGTGHGAGHDSKSLLSG